MNKLQKTFAVCAVLTAALVALELTKEVKADILDWKPPEQRENGDLLESSDLGGYEIRGFRGGTLAYNVVIENGATRRHNTGDLSFDAYTIAAYDTDGLFSEFVPITPTKPLEPPTEGELLEAPTDGELL